MVHISVIPALGGDRSPGHLSCMSLFSQEIKFGKEWERQTNGERGFLKSETEI